MPPKLRSRSKRSKETKQKSQQNNRRGRERTKKKPNNKKAIPHGPVIDFSQLRLETLLEIKKHYNIQRNTNNPKELSKLIFDKFHKQKVDEKTVIQEFLRISKEY
ncbi:histone deacetylase complex subunit sap30l [Anaeramoeba flamelloides]|uniref:Histone deacetylase complex subunit sap30l n=1 Tax=Anaeramoeba flamelloides TaxID=1746091 RepID=A0AAV7YSC2_9EUKA|nr:histone deacetylase complex subunit sap30l [Anaeramoeba flamelloides]KAJ6238702.1 histone deacetylase complex subunit sap30l [Anaeramoeba flamelloides]